MIRVICNQETFVYNAYHMVKAFYPSETVTSSVDEKASNCRRWYRRAERGDD